MDRRIRELQRQAFLGDDFAAEALEAALGRIGREALRYKEPIRFISDPIEAQEQKFDQTSFHRKMGIGWITTRCTCCGAGSSTWRPYSKRWIMRLRKRHNAKHRTLRTHRNPKARK